MSSQTSGATAEGAGRSVLIVSYYFPPSGGPGVQRVLKFVKYLPSFGWTPLVLTVREDAEYPARDPSLGDDVPSCARVVRTGIHEFYRMYRTMGGRQGPIDVASRSREARPNPILRALRASLFIPDGRVGWIPHALGPGTRLAREGRASVLFSSGPPFTANVIGALLHRRTGLPWIQDYRDPWTGAAFYPDRPGPARRVEERLEAWMLETASHTLTVNREIAGDLTARYKIADPGRFVVLPNGFDEEDFEGIDRSNPSKLTLAYTGTLFAARDPKALRAALTDLCREEEGFADSTEIVFAGRIDEAVAAAFRAPPLDRIARFPGYLPHRESLRLLRSSHVCLLLVGEERGARGMLTGKLFEYLGSGTPILALAHEGEATEIIHACRAGWSVPPDDAEALKTRLRSFWRSFRKGDRLPATPDREEILQYSRRRLARRLAALLEEQITLPSS